MKQNNLWIWKFNLVDNLSELQHNYSPWELILGNLLIWHQCNVYSIQFGSIKITISALWLLHGLLSTLYANYYAFLKTSPYFCLLCVFNNYFRPENINTCLLNGYRVILVYYMSQRLTKCNLQHSCWKWRK